MNFLIENYLTKDNFIDSVIMENYDDKHPTIFLGSS